MGRRPIGKIALTNAQRQRRFRAKHGAVSSAERFHEQHHILIEKYNALVAERNEFRDEAMRLLNEKFALDAEVASLRLGTERLAQRADEEIAALRRQLKAPRSLNRELTAR